MPPKILKRGNPFVKSDMPTAEEQKMMQKAKSLLYLSNMIFFGLSVVLIVIGICYLTAFRHDYTFTYFSVSSMAGVFLAFGIIILILSILNVICISSQRFLLIIGATLIILVLFIGILILGIWALAINSSDMLLTESRNEMIDAIKRYDERMPERFDTMRMDWIQTRYNCCGIDTYSDWRTLFLYAGQYSPNRYVDQWTVNNNLPYIDFVPDSCCIYQQYNCGKQFRYNQDPMMNMNRNSIINTRGCLPIYLFYLSKDLVFNGALAIALAGVALILGGVLIAFYFVLNRFS